MADRGDETTTRPGGGEAGRLFGGSSLRDALRAVAGLREPTTRADVANDVRTPVEPVDAPQRVDARHQGSNAEIQPIVPSQGLIDGTDLPATRHETPGFISAPATRIAAAPRDMSPVAEVPPHAPDAIPFPDPHAYQSAAPQEAEQRDIAEVLGVAPSPISMQPQRVPATAGQTKLLRSEDQILDLAAAADPQLAHREPEVEFAEVDPARRVAEASVAQAGNPQTDAAAPVFADATLDANVGHVAPIHDLAEPLVMRQNSEATDAMALADGAARVDASISAASSMAVEGTTDETELSAAALVTTNESERDMTGDDESTDQTRLVRGVQKPGRDDYFQEPVVAWLVVIGGPGLGAFRPVYEGNNALGRAPTQRIAIDFGDDAISAEEQAYIRYDSTDRTFLFVPNLAKTNVVSLNETKPTSAVPLTPMDVITVGKTQLVFVPFCGPEFDWSELKAIGSGGA